MQFNKCIQVKQILCIFPAHTNYEKKKIPVNQPRNQPLLPIILDFNDFNQSKLIEEFDFVTLKVSGWKQINDLNKQKDGIVVCAQPISDWIVLLHLKPNALKSLISNGIDEHFYFSIFITCHRTFCKNDDDFFFNIFFLCYILFKVLFHMKTKK